MRTNKLIIFTLIFTFLFLVFNFADAQYGFTDFLGGAPGQQLGIQWFFNLINRLTCYFYRFAIVVVVIMLVWYGISMTRSGGAQGLTDAKKALTTGLLGGLVIFGVITIILSVTAFLGVDDSILDMFKCN